MDDPIDPWFAPEPRTIWSSIKNLYQYWLPPIMAIAALLWLSSGFFFRLPRPPVGTFIALLAGMAVIVTIWPPETNWSKAAWLTVFFVLTGLEISTLYREREENQTQQVAVRKQENDAFQSIADGLKASIQQSQEAFAATMRQMKGLETLSVQNINTITGGDSFPEFILTRPLDGRDGLGFPLFAITHGKHDLVGCTISVLEHTQDIGGPDFARRYSERQTQTVPLLTSRMGTILSLRLMPFRDRPDQFHIDAVCRNGTFIQEFMLRPTKEFWDMTGKVVDASQPTYKLLKSIPTEKSKKTSR